MMGAKRIYILPLLLFSFMMNVKAQQTIQFSQYVFNGLAINPAYAGYKDDLTLNISSRIQWVGINDAPQTAVASADWLTNNKNIGLGLITTFDRLGPENTSSIYANYAYRLQLDELDTKRICFGIAFGAAQYSVDGSKFNAIDAADGSIPTGLQSKFTPDFRFGVYYYSPNVYFGASVFNLLSQPINNLIDNTPVVQPARTVYLTGGTMLPLSEYVDVKPSLMIKEDFKGPTNIDLTAYLVFNKIVWVGASCRTGVSVFNTANLQSGLQNADAVAAIAQFYINDHFRIGYSFDFTMSKLANYQSGSHELSLSLSFPGKKPRIVSPRYF
jgi:type IX secretion system PorP/SprF family membrane protein